VTAQGAPRLAAQNVEVTGRNCSRKVVIVV